MKTMMTTARLLVVCSLFCLWSANAAEPTQAVDLSHWKLTLPVNGKGELGGHAAEISAARLVAGYSHPDYFQIGSDVAISFWVPVSGATTDNADYPRCELREMLDPNDDSVNWPARGTHAMQARCRVAQLPSSKKVIIGQIHSFTGKARPLIKLQYYKDRVEALVKRSPTQGGDHKLVLATVELDSDITFEIRLDEGELSIMVNGNTERVNILENDPAWAEQTFYFKAGAYCQDNDGPETEGARVTFSRLRVAHSGPARR